MASISPTSEENLPPVAALDVLRGLAVVLMIVNHVAVQLSSASALQEPGLAGLVFVGSFAPVLFFFSTGFGIGLSRPRVGTTQLLATATKAGLLVVADQFMWWRQGVPYGLDFLAFIGISSVLITLISARSGALKLSAVLIACDLAIRFGYGPWAKDTFGMPGWWAWIVGVRALPNVSYPLSPWMVYPLLGFLFGRTYRMPRVGWVAFLWRWLGLGAATALLFAFILELRHAIFFRWGTMSFGYFELSLGVVLASMSFAWKVNEWWPRGARWVALRGVASLAVVPIHYALIELLAANALSQMSATASLVAIVALLIVSVGLAKTFAISVAQGAGILSRPIALLALLCVAIALAWMTVVGSLASLGAFVAGQLLVACLLGVGNRKRAAIQTRGEGTDRQVAALSARDS